MTLDEAAQYLNLAFEDDIPLTRNDVIRLALGGNLTLSIEFTQKAYARAVRFVSNDENSDDNSNKDDTADSHIIPLGDDSQMVINKELIHIEGWWGICILWGAGNECLRYLLKPIPPEQFDYIWDNTFPSVNALVLCHKDNNGEISYVQLANDRTSLNPCYHGDGCLDPLAILSNLVIRTSELDRLINTRVSDEESGNDGDEEPSPKSRNTYLRTIFFLCRYIYGDPIEEHTTAANAIEATLKLAGVKLPIQSRTLGEYIRDGRELEE